MICNGNQQHRPLITETGWEVLLLLSPCRGDLHCYRWGGSAECTHDSPESLSHSLPSNMLDISFVVVHIASDLRGMPSSAKERSHSRLLCWKSTARVHHMVFSQDVTSSWLSQQKKKNETYFYFVQVAEYFPWHLALKIGRAEGCKHFRLKEIYVDGRSLLKRWLGGTEEDSQSWRVY